MLHAKKLLSLLLCAGLIAGLFPTGARAEEPQETPLPPAEITAAAGDVLIDENTFPDANFRKYVLTLPGAGDGVLTEAEAAGIMGIAFGRSWNTPESEKIADLTGIEKFPALEALYCDSNRLTKLDVSQNPALEYLSCSSNQLTELDVSQNPALEYLSCGDNQLTELDVRQNSALVNLRCGPNQLTELDVSRNPALGKLECDSNQLTKLDVRQNPALWHFDCRSNQLTELDVRQNPALGYLYCNSNQLTELDVRQNPALEDLGSSSNQLTELDVNQNPALWYLDCGSNQLTSLDVSENPVLEILHCDSNQLTELDASQNPKLEYLDCESNQLTELDVGQNPALVELYCYGNCLAALDVSMNPLLTDLRCSGNVYETTAFRNITIPGLDVSRIEEKSLSGGFLENGMLSFLPGASYMRYRYQLGNGETEWFGIRCTAEGLRIDENSFPDANFREYVMTLPGAEDGVFTEKELGGIFTIDLGCNEETPESEKIADLTGIEWFRNLYSLNCSYNRLTELDVSQNPALENLNCGFNQLTNLDMSQNSALVDLCCRNNQLTKLDVSQSPALKKLVCWSNQLTELNVSQNPALKELGCGSNQLRELDVSQSPALERLYCESNQLTKLDVSQNPELGTLLCRWNQLTELDVSHNPSLVTLDCMINQLTELDASQNPVLKELLCNCNQIAELDVRQNPALVELNCESNQLTELDVRQNPAMEWLYCGSNQLTKLDVRQNPVLETLICRSNQLTELDVNQNIALEYLYCDHNQLTKVDVRQNPALEVLYCGSNQLTNLDISRNPNLRRLECYGNVRETAEARKLDLPGLERSRVHELIGGHWEAGKLSFHRDSTEITYRYDLGNGETEVFTIRLVPVYEPIRAEFVKKGWKGEQIVPLTVEPDGSMQVPKTGGRHYFWRSEDGQLAVKSKGTLTYGQLLEALGGSAPADSVVRFRIADDRNPVTRTVTVRFFDGPAEIGTAAVEVVETAASVRAEHLKKLLPAGYDFAEPAEEYPIGADGEVRVTVMDASLVQRPVTVLFTLKGSGHIKGIMSKTLAVSVAADGSVKAPYAESFHKTKSVTWTTADGALTLKSGESVTYETLRELLGGTVPGDAQITFTGTTKRR